MLRCQCVFLRRGALFEYLLDLERRLDLRDGLAEILLQLGLVDGLSDRASHGGQTVVAKDGNNQDEKGGERS